MCQCAMWLTLKQYKKERVLFCYGFMLQYLLGYET